MEVLEKEDGEIQLPLTRLFNTATAKVLDFLLTNEGLFYTEDEISELTTIPARTLQRSIQILLNEHVIKRERKNGRTFYYTANLSSPRVSGLLSYINSTLMFNLEDTIKKNIKKIKVGRSEEKAKKLIYLF